MKDFNFIIRQAIMLQKSLWNERKHLTIANIDDPIQLLDPMVIMEYLNLNFEEPEELGYFDDHSEVAGIFYRPENKIYVAKKFRPEPRRFTAIHEIGHSLLHEGMVYHRDRPLDGSMSSRNIVEIQADRFTAEFLMPKKLVGAELKLRFPNFTGQFIFNDDTASLLGKDLRTLREMPTRYRSVKVASVESYGGNYFNSMHTRFKVSKTAMAIRLETLGFVK